MKREEVFEKLRELAATDEGYARHGGLNDELRWMEKEIKNADKTRLWIKIVSGAVVIFVIGGFGVGYLSRNYDVWAQGMLGKAKLAEATQSRQIAIEGAKAKQESATFEAEAEVRRAKGVAEANKIIGKSLQGNESYLRYLWVNQLSENNQNVIYIPTEANMPIMEAGKR